MANTSEQLDLALQKALEELESNRSEETVNVAKDLYQLKLEEQRINNDYYVKAQQVDNETQRNDIEIQKIKQESEQRKNDHNVINKLIDSVPDVVKTISTVTGTIVITKVVRNIELEGVIVQLPNLARDFVKNLFQKK